MANAYSVKFVKADRRWVVAFGGRLSESVAQAEAARLNEAQAAQAAALAGLEGLLSDLPSDTCARCGAVMTTAEVKKYGRDDLPLCQACHIDTGGGS